jgi:hypothetical protein
MMSSYGQQRPVLRAQAAGSPRLPERANQARQTHPRTVYSLTDDGRSALHAWLTAPAHFPRIKNEAHLRLLAGDMLSDTEIVESFRGMLPELDRLEALAREMYEQADRVPHRAPYLRLSHAYALQLVRLHREWVTEIERELVNPRLQGRGQSQTTSAVDQSL